MLRKYYFLIETAIGFAILIFINIYSFKESPAFIGTHPNPYWIIILLIACRYGSMQGIIVGSMAAVLYIYSGSKYELINFSAYTFPHGGYNLPFLFILTGGLLGEIRSIYKKKYIKLESKYKETCNDLQKLGLQHAALLEAKQELDKRIAYQTSTLLNLFERLNNMATLDPESLYSKIPELLEELLNAQCSSVYLLNGNKLELYIRRGKQGVNKIPDTVEVTYGLMGEVIKTKNVVTINQFYTDQELVRFNKLDLIMSAPIKSNDDTIIGIINIERMPFFDFNSYTVRIFAMLSYWISIIIDKALQFQQLKDRNIEEEIAGVQKEAEIYYDLQFILNKSDYSTNNDIKSKPFSKKPTFSESSVNDIEDKKVFGYEET